MTYQDFLNTLVSPITSFLSWAGTMTTALMSNYVFITVVGLYVITSLFWLFYNVITSFTSYKSSKKHNLDNGGKK